MSNATDNDAVDDDVPEEVIVGVTDYLDGTLKDPQRAEVAKKIETDAVWKRTYDEMREARDMISGLQKARPRPPDTFVEDVTATIRKRSAGRFFGRRTLGDRVPFGVLLIVAIVALAVIAWMMRSSPTGSLKVDKHGPAPAPTKPMMTP